MHVLTKKWGMPPPINLARTSLAAVSASSVNGSRPMDDPYYGVLNAFDEGSNWFQKINYTTWLSSNEPVPWIEVAFDRPITLASVFVQGGPRFSIQAFPVDGGEYDFQSCLELLLLNEPLPNVGRVRVNFHREDADGLRPIAVVEVRVFGYSENDSDWRQGPPRVMK